MWFANAALRVSGDVLEVLTDSAFVAKWIDANFSRQLLTASQHVLERAVRISVGVANEPADEQAASSKRPAARPSTDQRHASELPAPSIHAGPHTNGHGVSKGRPRKNTLRRLDDFIVGASNKLAYSTACRLAQDPEARCVSPLFIHGECGVGKTHLLQGVCQRHINLTGRTQHVRYVTGEQFTNEYITAIRNNSLDAFRQRLRQLDLLAIDDVHFLSNKVK